MIDTIFLFSDVIFLKILIMYLVLSLPIPSTPYLVYLAIYETLIDFGVIYVLASTLFILSYFFFGLIFNKIKNRANFSKFKVIKKNSKIFKTVKKILFFSKKKLLKINLKNIVVLRLIGVHAALIAFGSGMLKVNLIKNIIANFILAILDVLFYWALAGSGKFIIKKLFPKFNIELFLQEYLFFTLSLSLIVFYLSFFLYKFVKSNQKKKLSNFFLFFKN